MHNMHACILAVIHAACMHAGHEDLPKEAPCDKEPKEARCEKRRKEKEASLLAPSPSRGLLQVQVLPRLRTQLLEAKRRRSKEVDVHAFNVWAIGIYIVAAVSTASQ